MCGRYYLEISDEEMQNIAKTAKQNALQNYRDISIKTSGEIYPADTVPVQVSENEFIPMKWGFALPSKKLLINARFETFTEKPTFKNCSRCLIPASGYFEWKRDTIPKVKYAFSVSEKMLFLAGLYKNDKKSKDTSLADFVILTREAVGVAADIHHRMPVIIPREKAGEWLYGGFNISDAITDIDCKEADNPEQTSLF
jgi:putative SOS response-associated peptidase YedK